MSADIDSLSQIEAKHHDKLFEVVERLEKLPRPFILSPKEKKSPYSILNTFTSSLRQALNHLGNDRPFLYPHGGTDGKYLFHLRFWKVANTLQSLIVLLPLIEPLYNPESETYPDNPECHRYFDQPVPQEEAERVIRNTIAASLKELQRIYQDFLEVINESTYAS